MAEKFIGKLQDIYKRYCELSEKLSDPAVISDTALWTKTAKDQSELTETAQKYEEYLSIEKQMRDAEEAAATESDAEMRELLSFEVLECGKKLSQIKDELKILLLPKDKNDDRNCIMEIRGGAGGEEAALFAYELYRMYLNYCERHRLKVEVVDANETELGGIKEVVVNIAGKDAYKQLKFESGVHRVQRVPETESQGRVHTSTATVAVLPEAEDVEVEIKDEDIRVDVYRSSGAGGQKVNKTETAIRITHFPTGIVVTCQDERSQLKNKDKAFKVLRSRLYDYYNSQNRSAYDEHRKSLVGRGDRSERIRTYNFPQGRVTDHRIGLSLYSLDTFMMGDIEEMTEALAVAERENMLAGGEE
ncbi:MAG: peptide chain release factor 1 [Clostridia bacterium]|nr:peptide chain release factor 1 [Clostridia bacterium]